MNGLSWLIYLADVVGGFGKMAAIVLFVAIVIFCICLIVRAVVLGDAPTLGKAYDGNDKDNEFYKKQHESALVDHDKMVKMTSQTLKISGLTFVLIGLFNIIVPSRQTVMMIATSELAESAASTKSVSSLAGKSYEALERFLDSYLVEKKD